MNPHDVLRQLFDKHRGAEAAILREFGALAETDKEMRAIIYREVFDELRGRGVVECRMRR